MTGNYILLFDGVCNLCNASVRFVIRRDRHRRFRFAPSQSEAARKLLDEYGLTGKEAQSVMLIENGTMYTASDALLRVIRRLCFPWPILYIFILIPVRIRDYLYNWVGRNRYRWFGRKDTCMVPGRNFTDRFLD